MSRFTSLALPPPTHESLVPCEDISQSIVPTPTPTPTYTESRLASTVRTLLQRYRNRRTWRDRYPTEQSLVDALVKSHQFTDSDLAPFRHWGPEHITSWTAGQLVDWAEAQKDISYQTIATTALKVTGQDLFLHGKRFADMETVPGKVAAAFIKDFKTIASVQSLLKDGPHYNHSVAGHKLLSDILEEEFVRHFDTQHV